MNGIYSGTDTLLTISVLDEDLNFQPSDYLSVTVTTSKDNEYEVVPLVQDGINSNSFTSVLRTCSRCYMRDCNLDFLSYEEVSNTNIGSGLVLPEGSVVFPNGIVVPTLTAPGLSPLQASMILRCPSEIEGESNDGYMFVEPGDVLTTTYNDQMPIGSHQAYTHIARSGLLQITPLHDLVTGSNLTLDLLDQDLDNDPLHVESAYITVETDQIGVVGTTVRLIEDGLNSGRFTGNLQTVQWVDCTSSCDPATASLMSIGQAGTIAVSPGGILYISYTSTSTGAEQNFHVNIASVGSIFACPTVKLASCLFSTFVRDGINVALGLVGDEISVNVTDHDLISNLIEITVMAYPYPNFANDYEQIFMNWVGMGSLTGSLLTSGLNTSIGTATPNDGILLVSENCEITFTYLDPSPPVSSECVVRMAMRGILKLDIQLLEGIPTLTVILIDNDLVMNTSNLESTLIYVWTHRYGNDSIAVRLLQNDVSNGTFEGTLSLQSARSVRDHIGDSLWGHSGDIITVTYYDNLPIAVVNSTIVLHFPGSLQVPAPFFAINTLLEITLIDGDLDTNSTVTDIVDGAVKVFKGNILMLSINLVETEVSSATFTGSIFPLDSKFYDFSSPAQIAPIIDLTLGASLTFEYTDLAPAFTTQKKSQSAFLGELSIQFISIQGKGNLKIELFNPGVFLPVVVVIFTSRYSENMGLQISLQNNISNPDIFYVLLSFQEDPISDGYKLSNSSIKFFSGDLVYARYFDQLTDWNIFLSAVVPSPSFIDPSPQDLKVFLAYQDCPFQILIVAADLSTNAQRLNGSAIVVYPTRYLIVGFNYKSGIIPDGLFSMKSDGFDNATAIFSWLPRAEQQGTFLRMCFAVGDSLGIINPINASESERCFQIEVVKCKQCVLQGENLNQIASAILADWKLLWSLNLALKDPAMLQEGALLNTSILYSVQTGDTLASLAVRFKTSIKTLLALNPDISNSAQVAAGAKICIVPDTRVFDSCPPPAKSSTWEPLDEQYVPPSYFDNPYNWEIILWTDPRGLPTKQPNPNYPQRPDA